MCHTNVSFERNVPGRSNEANAQCVECKPVVWRRARAEPRLVGAVHVVAVQGDVAHALHRLRTRHPAEPARRLAHYDLHAHRRRLYARALTPTWLRLMLLPAAESLS